MSRLYREALSVTGFVKFTAFVFSIAFLCAAIALAQAPQQQQQAKGKGQKQPTTQKQKAPAKAPAKKAAPKYTELQFKDVDPGDAKAMRLLLSDKNKVLRGTTPLNQGRDTLDSYYKNYFFRSMTHLDQLGDLTKKRQLLMRDFYQCRERRDVHDYLVQTTFDYMKVIAAGAQGFNPHPGARYNAMLIVGSLNQDEGNPARKIAPTPHPASQQLIMTEFANTNQHPAVRIAALVGIMRHVKARKAGGAMPPQVENSIKQQMFALVRAKKAPQGVDPSHHVWIRRRAVDILAIFGEPGNGGAVIKALDAIVGDATEAPSLRFTAAMAIGKFDYNAPLAGVDTLAMAKNLGALAVLAAYAEDARVEDEKKRAEREEALKNEGGFTGGGGDLAAMFNMGQEEGGGDEADSGDMAAMFGAGGNLGGDSPAIKDLPPDEIRKILMTKRRLLYPLYCVHLGLGSKRRTLQKQDVYTGLLAATPDGSNEKKEIQEIVDRVTEVMQVMLPEKKSRRKPKKDDDEEEEGPMDHETIMKEIRKAVRKLEQKTPLPEPIEETGTGPVAEGPLKVGPTN